MDPKIYLLTIDSRDRDKSVYPLPNSYVYFLYDVIKNVEKVDLVYALYEKVGTEFYVNLHIDEFQNNVVSNNNTIRGAFMQLPLLNYMNEFAADKFTSSQLFQKPISKLSRLTIKFMAYDGSLYPMKEHLLIFKISYFAYIGNIHFHANGSMNIEDEHLILLDLHPNYTKDELNESYAMKKSSLQTQQASANELAALKRAYKALYYRLKE